MTTSSRLAGKTAFITAAGQGIGRATALAFVREGARVIASDISAELLAKLADETGCSTRRLDVTDAAAIAAAAQAVGAIDVLFNGAGFVHAGTVLDCSDAGVDAGIDASDGGDTSVGDASVDAMPDATVESSAG